MTNITALQVHYGSFNLQPFHILGTGLITLCEGQWVIADEWSYCPVLVNGKVKLLGINVEPDCDGMVYSYNVVDQIEGTWGKEVVINDYLMLSLHIANCRF